MVQSINKQAAECLVFFNPLSTDSRFWTKIVPKAISDKYECVFFDYPGYNNPFIKLNTFSELAYYINEEVLNKIDKPMHLVGYSYGGLLVQYLLNNQYCNLKSAILIACANNILPRDKEILSVLKKISETDMYLFCRALTLFSHGHAEINKNPLMGLQKFSNLKLSTTDIIPVLQQINHILKVTNINIRKQNTEALLIYGAEDRVISTETLDCFNAYFENFSIRKLYGEAHIINPNKMFYHIHKFLNSLQHEPCTITY